VSHSGSYVLWAEACGQPKHEPGDLDEFTPGRAEEMDPHHRLLCPLARDHDQHRVAQLGALLSYMS
jgi:hypothetical protein